MKKTCLLIMLLIGCESNVYQMIKNDDGSVYRLNQKTGEMVLIKDTKIIDLKQEREWREAEEIELKSMAVAKAWEPETIPGTDLGTIAQTSWRDGKVYLKVYLKPYQPLHKFYEKLRYLDGYTHPDPQILFQKRKEYARISQFHITYIFTDADGLTIWEHPVLLSSFTRTVDEDGVPSYLSYETNGPMAKADYRATRGVSIKWNIDTKYITSVEKRD